MKSDPAHNGSVRLHELRRGVTTHQVSRAGHIFISRGGGIVKTLEMSLGVWCASDGAYGRLDGAEGERVRGVQRTAVGRMLWRLDGVATGRPRVSGYGEGKGRGRSGCGGAEAAVLNS